jgi:hypothetical protein
LFPFYFSSAVYLTKLSLCTCIASNGTNDELMNDEMERIWKKLVVASSRYYPRTFLEGLRKTTNQDSHCPERDSNWAHPEFKLELACYLQYIILFSSYLRFSLSSIFPFIFSSWCPMSV